MKNTIFFIFLSSCILLSVLTSCSQKQEDFKEIDYNKGKESQNVSITDSDSDELDYLTYELKEQILSFDIGEDGSLYCITADMGTHLSNIDVLNQQGDIVCNYSIPYTDVVCMENSNLYYLHSTGPDTYSVAAIDTTSRATNKVCNVSDFTYSKFLKLEVIDGKLFYIAMPHQFEFKLFNVPNSFYQIGYNGEKLGCIDLSTGDYEELSVEKPVSMSKTLDGNLIIYAADEEKGYFFTEYNTKQNTFSERVYHNMGDLKDFTIFNENNDFQYIKSTGIQYYTLTAASLEPDTEEIELYPDIMYSVYLKFKDGYTYIKNENSNRLNIDNNAVDEHIIFRINNTTFNRGTDTITLLSPQDYESHAPFGCGYTIKQEYKTEEELALSILSQDEDFDMFFMDSSLQVSANIRDKGSFYPLNNVDGVDEYLDAAFPYVKAAATDQDGNVWMIPIYINTSCIVYNEDECKQNELKFTNNMSLDDLLQIFDKVRKDKALENLYSYSNYGLIKNLMYQYTRNNKNFNNKQFRDLAQLFKNKTNYTVNDSFGNFDVVFRFMLDHNSEFLFFYTHNYMFLDNKLDENNIGVCKVPSITENKTNTVTCFFLCVNPASKKLNTTLQYISSFCRYMLADDKNIILQNRDIYPEGRFMDDLYEIYANGDIQFTYPQELYWDDLVKYLKDEKDLDSVIKDADLRLDMYLNE